MPVFTKNEKKILYVHVPKAGGSTVERIFEDAGYKKHYYDGATRQGSLNRLRRCSPQHMDRQILQALFRIERFDVVFMTVREPLARFRSEYAMRNSDQLAARMKDVKRWSAKVLRRYEDDQYILDNHLRPQHEFYVPGALAYRLEDGLEAMVEDLNARFGLGLAPEVPRVRDRRQATGIASSDVALPRRLRRRLVSLYREDFEAFGYRPRTARPRKGWDPEAAGNSKPLRDLR